MHSEPSVIEILLLHSGDDSVLSDIAPGVFDHEVQPQFAAEFLNDARHHLVVAREAGRVIGFCSAVHYLHPDKPPELWINEVGVAPSHHRRGVAKWLLNAIFDVGRTAGCNNAWVLTDGSNAPALRLYRSVGGVESHGRPMMFEFALDGRLAAQHTPSPPAAGVRAMRPDERPAVLEMMLTLWPEAGDYDFSDETIFVWQQPDGGLGGFVSFSLRPWAEGCDSAPVPYLEGWWVAPDLRRTGVGRALIAQVERWCREHGYRELGSDAETANATSLAAHAALGFEPTLEVQFFRKQLG